MYSKIKEQLILVIMLLILINLLSCTSKSAKPTNENIYLRVVNPVNTNILNEAKIFSSLAHNYFLKGQYKDALKAYKKAITNLTKIDNYKEIGKTYNNISNVYIKMGKIKKATESIKISFAINKKYNFISGKAMNYNNLGLINEAQKKYDLAIKNYQLALSQYLKTTSSYAAIANQHNNIGYIYLKKKLYKKSGNNFKKALILLLKSGKDNGAIAETYSFLGTVKINNKEYKKAIIYFHNALNYDKSVENISGIASDLKNIALGFEHLNNFSKAEEFYTRAMKINIAQKNKKRIIADLKNIIRINTMLKNNKKVKKLKSFLKKLTRKK